VIDDPWDAADGEETLEGPAHRRRREARRSPSDDEALPRERRRWLVLLVVAASLVLAGVASDAVHPPAAPAVPAAAAAADGGLPVIVASAARSASWYCPGPLPFGGGAASQLVLVSTGPAPVTARVEVTSTTGVSRAVGVTVPAGGTIRVPVLVAGPSGWAAAAVLVDGGGIGVWQQVSTGLGTSEVSCHVAPSSSWYLPAGSTAHGADVLVSLFDPTASPAVASLSFASAGAVATGSAITSVGSTAGAASPPVAPPAFQGLIVQPGQLVLVDVGKQVQLRAELATIVTASTGRIVAGEWSAASVAGRSQAALVEGSPSARSQWWFPVSTATASKTLASGYWLLNPGASTTRVTILQSVSPSTTVSSSFEVPAGSLELVSMPPPPAPLLPAHHARGGTPALGWATVESTGGGVVAARGVFVDVGSHGKVAPVGFPQVAMGSPATNGTFVLAGPALPVKAAHSGPTASLAIAAPAVDGGRAAVIVKVYALDGASGATTTRLATFAVEPGTVDVVAMPVAAGTSGGILVVADGPVLAQADYEGGFGSVGLTSIGTALD
jgi:hypothetical protein